LEWHVSVVEPGNYNSNIGKNALARIGADSKAANSPGYQVRADRSNFKEPDEVAMAVEQALLEPNPKRPLYGGSQPGRGGDYDQEAD